MVKELKRKPRKSIREGGALTGLSVLGNECIFSSTGTWMLNVGCVVFAGGHSPADWLRTRPFLGSKLCCSSLVLPSLTCPVSHFISSFLHFHFMSSFMSSFIPSLCFPPLPLCALFRTSPFTDVSSHFRNSLSSLGWSLFHAQHLRRLYSLFCPNHQFFLCFPLSLFWVNSELALVSGLIQSFRPRFPVCPVFLFRLVLIVSLRKKCIH